MARILPTDVVPAFLKAYGVTTFGDTCAPEDLTVKIWDRYGTAPKDGDVINPTGSFVAAIAFCDSCDKSIILNRDDLEAVQK
jgi:hypothetical protein